MIKENNVCELLGIEHPIIQGGMAWVANASLASAVSNAGGLGIIAAGGAPTEVVKEEILKAKQLTSKPFGVNLMLMSPYAEEIAHLVVELGVKVVTTGAGSPAKYIPMWKEAGIVVCPVVASAAIAKRMEKAGADLIIAEGCEAGGHIGQLTTFALVPQVVDAVNLPVFAAGGIADRRGVAAAFALGAQGVQVGTRFLTAKECTIHDNYKQAVLKATDNGTAVTGHSTGHPVRALKNTMTRKFLDLEKQGVPFEELEKLTLGSLRKAVVDGNVNEGSFMAGQIAGLVKSEGTCKEIIDELFSMNK